MAAGIRDRVAIVGMGCSRFGERWGDNAEDLMLEALQEALNESFSALGKIFPVGIVYGVITLYVWYCVDLLRPRWMHRTPRI